MSLDNSKLSVAMLLHSLSERLRRVLVEDARKFAATAKTAITLDIYLAALYRAYPEEVAAPFSRRESLDNLADMFSPIDVAAEIAPQEIPGEPPAIFLLKIDEQLLNILWAAAQVSPTSGRGAADIADFLRALSLDGDSMTRLARDRGLYLSASLG